MSTSFEIPDPSQSAISFKMSAKLWQGFRNQTDGLFIARAPFLDYVIARELPHLQEDLKGYRMSVASEEATRVSLRPTIRLH